MVEPIKKEEAPALDAAAIQAKLTRGEELSDKERKFAEGDPDFDEPAKVEKKDDEVVEGDQDPDDEPAGEDTPDPKTGDDDEEPEPVDDKKPDEDDDAEPAPGAKKKQTPEERKALIEAELEKPDAETDLSQFNATEIGLYWNLKRERRRRQKVEDENRVLRFNEVQRGLKKEEPEPDDKEEDLLAGKDDEDVLTVGEIKKLLDKKEKEAKKASKPLLKAEEVRPQYNAAAENLKAKGINDFHDVAAYAQYALEGDEEAQEELRETVKVGGNVLEKTYYLIKGSKKWSEIEKDIQDRKPKKPVGENEQKRAKKFEENAKKVRTTGAGGGGGVPTGEYSIEDIQRMSPKDFGRLPKKTQDAILLKYGSEPNYSV